MAVYRPILLSPSVSEVRDMLKSQIFSATLTSKTTDYQVRIYNNNSGELIYDSTKLNLTSILHSGETLSHTVPITIGFVGIVELKWTIQIWNGVETLASNQLKETYFQNYEDPSVTLVVPAIIESQKYLFEGVYAQNQNIEVYQYKYLLTDLVGNIIIDTDWIYNESLKYELTGFINDSSYKVKIQVLDINSVFSESLEYEFSVVYDSPSVTFIPNIQNIEEESCIKIEWTGAYAIEGVLTGTSSYIQDYLQYSNWGLNLGSNSNIKWDDVNISEDYTYTLLWAAEQEITGPITKISNSVSGLYFEVGFDFSNNKFYRDINGIIEYTNESYPLVKTYVYIIGLQYNKLFIKPVAVASAWSGILEGTWGDLAILTWDDVLKGNI